MTKEYVLFRFSRDTETPGPFQARVEFIDSLTGMRYFWQDESFFANNTLRITLRSTELQIYTVKLLLDNQLAFEGRYQEEDLPF